MPDFLDVLASDALGTIKEGYYEQPEKNDYKFLSFTEAISKINRAAIIAEIKFASPSQGVLKEKCEVEKIAETMARAGVAGISILTEPKHFKGNMTFLSRVRKKVEIPLLMKDIILDSIQIDSGKKAGANAVLLIQAIFDRGYGKISLQKMIDYSHSIGLEVLLETCTEKEFFSAIKTDADLIGINNRNLTNLEVNIETTKHILAKIRPLGKIIVSESGINSPHDIRILKNFGVNAFLVGTTLMKANNLMEATKQMVEVL